MHAIVNVISSNFFVIPDLLLNISLSSHVKKRENSLACINNLEFQILYNIILFLTCFSFTLHVFIILTTKSHDIFLDWDYRREMFPPLHLTASIKSSLYSADAALLLNQQMHFPNMVWFKEK